MAYIRKDEWFCDFLCDRCDKSVAQELLNKYGKYNSFPAITEYGIEIWRTELIDNIINAIVNHNPVEYSRKIEMPNYFKFIEVEPSKRRRILDNWRYNKRNNTITCDECAMILNKK